MSIYGALRAGVSGLYTQSQAMGIVSDNIANVNTPGYKRASARFSSFVINQDAQSYYTPGGANVKNVRENGEQGSLVSAKSPSDISVSGNGYFVVTDKLTLNERTGEWEPTGQIAYTRSGQFRPNRYGNLRNAEGHYLLAWPREGDVAALEDDATYRESNRIGSLRGVNVAKATYPPVPTSFLDLGVNLNSDTEARPTILATATPLEFDYEVSTVINDRQGNVDTLTLRFLKTGVNTWNVHAMLSDDSTSNFRFMDNTAFDRNTREIQSGNISAVGGGRGNGTALADRFDLGTITFHANGTLASVAPVGTNADGNAANEGVLTLFIDADADAATPVAGVPESEDRLAIDIDFGTIGNSDGFSHFYSTSSTPKYIDQNGKAYSSLTGVSFGETGVMQALFANGEARSLYKVPLATFTNPNGLRDRSGNIWLQTEQSGQSLLREATTGGAGAVVGSAVEQSTTDLASEFSDMIIYQRAYSAATKIMTVADDMLEELIRAKR